MDLGASDQDSLLQSLAEYCHPFALIGGPPCQGFSSAGARCAADPRNGLIFNYFALVRHLQPRWFVLENVEGLLTAGGGKCVYDLVRQFLELGYSIRLEKVNFAAYGLPQSRKRVMIIGNRMGLAFHLPQETHSYASGKHNLISLFPNSPTLLEAISGLPRASLKKGSLPYEGPLLNDYDLMMREGNHSGLVTEHYSLPGSDLDLERYRKLQPGQTMKDLPEALWHSSFGKRAFRRVKDGTPTEKRGGAPSGLKRLHGDLCSLTVTSAATREFIHPCEDRPLTPREAARLQSFPDYYEFVGNASSVITQIGNAVPPLVAAIFGRHLLELEGRVGSGRFIATVNGHRSQLLGFRLTDAGGMSPALATTERLLRSLAPNLVREEVAAYS